MTEFDRIGQTNKTFGYWLKTHLIMFSPPVINIVLHEFVEESIFGGDLIWYARNPVAANVLWVVIAIIFVTLPLIGVRRVMRGRIQGRIAGIAAAFSLWIGVLAINIAVFLFLGIAINPM